MLFKSRNVWAFGWSPGAIEDAAQVQAMSRWRRSASNHSRAVLMTEQYVELAMVTFMSTLNMSTTRAQLQTLLARNVAIASSDRQRAIALVQSLAQKSGAAIPEFDVEAAEHLAEYKRMCGQAPSRRVLNVLFHTWFQLCGEPRCDEWQKRTSARGCL